MAPRAMPGMPNRSLKAPIPSPSRVPPDQSSTCSIAWLKAASGSRDDSWRVSRVSRVPTANASTLALTGHGDVEEAQQRTGIRLH